MTTAAALNMLEPCSSSARAERGSPRSAPTLLPEPSLQPAQRDSSPFGFLALLARLVSAGVLAAWCMVGADACMRSGWPYISIAHHVAAALGLYGAVGALLGLLSAGLIWLEWRVIGRRLKLRARRATLYRCGFYGVVAGAASVSTAIATFNGEHVARTRAASAGPLLFVLCAGATAAVGSALLIRALEVLAAGSKARAYWPFVVLFLALGGSVVWVDLTQYVSLYMRLHTILELAAALILGAAFALILEALTRRVEWGEAFVRALGALRCAALGVDR